MKLMRDKTTTTNTLTDLLRENRHHKIDLKNGQNDFKSLEEKIIELRIGNERVGRDLVAETEHLGCKKE